jgi:predicted Zn-dependent peptidase
VLLDLVARPILDPQDVERERSVVIEEQRGVQDAPEDLIGDLAMESLWPDHPMGNSILGTETSLSRVSAGGLSEFHRGHYTADRLVIGASGAVDPDRLQAAIGSRFSLPEGPKGARSAPAPRMSRLLVHAREAAQTHLVLFTDAPAYDAPDRSAAQLLAEVLGGGMSSRLFQSIREEAGIAYSVYAYSDHFEDCGLFGVGLAVNPDRAREALERTATEIDRLLRDGLDPGELDAAKAQIRGGLIMGDESLTSRMFRIARAEHRGRGMETVEDRIAGYETITDTDVVELARTLFAPGRRSLVAVGPSRPRDLNAPDYAECDVVEDPE